MKTDLDQKYSTTGVTCRTYFNRTRRCYYYRRRETYINNISILFNRILRRASRKNIIPVFSEEYKNRAFLIRSIINKDDREIYKVTCVRIAINLNNLFRRFRIIKLMDRYEYRWKIKGFMHAVITTGRKEFNLSIVYDSNFVDEIPMYELNNFFYNKAKGKKNDLIIMNAVQNSFYIVPYADNDYTIQRGFLTFSRWNKLRIRGPHCVSCRNNCKPSFINNLDRLTVLLTSTESKLVDDKEQETMTEERNTND